MIAHLFATFAFFSPFCAHTCYNFRMSESKIAKVATSVNNGFDGRLITVECNITKGLPAFTLVGLAEKSIGESRERVRAAITSSGFVFPAKHITINLAPADIAKSGSHFDLPIALAILVASGQLLQKQVSGKMFVGELSLDGEIRPVCGALSFAETAVKNTMNTIFMPNKNSAQAALLTDIDVVPCTTLSDLVLKLIGEKKLTIAPKTDILSIQKSARESGDIDEIRGQDFAKRALVIAAAGHHNILFTGPPGSGKTMLAKTLPGLLPPMSLNEILETTKLWSLSGESDSVVADRPFRSPHNTISNAALAGGGTNANPGEISLSHNGVLFMDELPEFSRGALELLRQPLEDHKINISRANTKVSYPANFMLVATMNPCPCGYLGDPRHECTCTHQQIMNYQAKISGPLLDRIDMVVEVSPVDRDKMFAPNQSHDAARFREKIAFSQSEQLSRQHRSNSLLTNRQLDKFAHLDESAKNLLSSASEKLDLSARSHYKIIRVARTIADLAGRENISASDIAEALQFRGRKR